MPKTVRWGNSPVRQDQHSVFRNSVTHGKPIPLNHFYNKREAPAPVVIKTPADPEKLKALREQKERIDEQRRKRQATN